MCALGWVRKVNSVVFQQLRLGSLFRRLNDMKVQDSTRYVGKSFNTKHESFISCWVDIEKLVGMTGNWIEMTD